MVIDAQIPSADHFLLAYAAEINQCLAKQFFFSLLQQTIQFRFYISCELGKNNEDVQGRSFKRTVIY